MLLAAATAGCSVVGPIEHHVPAPPKPSKTARHKTTPAEAADKPAQEMARDYKDVAGVIHIHTQYSDGAGTFDDIARVANQLKLDYLIVTDHNTLQPLRDGKQGWYGMTLVLVGTELSTRAGHYLALGVHEEINRGQPTQAVIDEVARQGGLGFIAHPFFKKRRWTDWSVRGFTGVEVYNTVHDAFDENRLRLALWSIAMPPDPLYLAIIDRPYDPLATWDRLLAEQGRIVGIGSADAHEVRIFGLKIAPYEVMFKLVRTHLLVALDAELSADVIYDALRRGHAYVGIDLVTDAHGFTFLASDGTRVLGLMGDEVALGEKLQLTAALPATAQATLFKDGRAIATSEERVWHVPVTEPGIYRLEATRHGKPWIYSNPIYVRSPDVNTPGS